MYALKFFLGLRNPCTLACFCFFSLKKQNETNQVQTNKHRLLVKSEVLFDLPKGGFLSKGDHHFPPRVLRAVLKTLSCTNQKRGFHTYFVLFFFFLNVKFKICTIFIIADKKWNLYSVGLQKQLLKSDVSINILIRGIFSPTVLERVWKQMPGWFRYS